MKRTESFQVELQIAPLIDVCFLLLFFFMATARPKSTESHVALELARSGAEEDSFPPIEQQRLEILENGQVMWNESPTDRADSKDLFVLSAGLRSLREVADRAKSPVSVIINAADKAPYQRIIDVMVACQRSGIAEITFATDSVDGG